MLSNGLSKWIYTELSVNWIQLCRQSKSLAHSHQWLFASASFLYSKFSQYINTGIKKTLKKHCFNEGETETTGGGTFLQGLSDIWISESKDFLSQTLQQQENQMSLRLPWPGQKTIQTKIKYLQKLSALLHQKANLADVWWLRGMHFTGAVSESLKVSSTFCSAVSALLSTLGLSISSWCADI